LDILKYLRSKKQGGDIIWPEHIVSQATVENRRSAKKCWREYCERFEMRDDNVLVYICKKGPYASVPRRVISSAEKESIIQACHDDMGHFRQNKV
jgi:hypothetical protein